MNPDTVHQTLFATRWQRCTLELSSGENIRLEHPDWAFMPPGRSYVLVADQSDGYQVIACHHIVGLDIEPHATVSSPGEPRP